MILRILVGDRYLGFSARICFKANGKGKSESSESSQH
jgi:hypothetical protein